MYLEGLFKYTVPQKHIFTHRRDVREIRFVTQLEVK